MRVECPKNRRIKMIRKTVVESEKSFRGSVWLEGTGGTDKFLTWSEIVKE